MRARLGRRGTFLAGVALGFALDWAVAWWTGRQVLEAEAWIREQETALANCRLIEISAAAGIQVDQVGVSQTEWRARCDELEKRAGTVYVVAGRR